MSWHFSQAVEAGFSEANSSAGEPCVPSNGTPTHGTFWSPDKTTDASKASRSGMTYKPSTASRGAKLLTWCLEDSHAKKSQPREKVPESKASAAVCGSTWRESSARFDRASSSWKTHRCLWEEDLEWSSLTLPRWGMTRDGVLWERITPPLLTNEIESGSWLPTPLSTLGSNGGPNARDSSGRPGLQMAAMTWPTPAARVGKGSNSREHCETNGTGRKHMDQLANAIAYPYLRFATPQARDFRTGSTDRWDNPERSRNLNDQIGGQLNPTWVEWLMGWPLGWTDCAVSATDKFREWCRSHGIA